MSQPTQHYGAVSVHSGRQPQGRAINITTSRRLDIVWDGLTAERHCSHSIMPASFETWPEGLGMPASCRINIQGNPDFPESRYSDTIPSLPTLGNPNPLGPDHLTGSDNTPDSGLPSKISCFVRHYDIHLADLVTSDHILHDVSPPQKCVCVVHGKQTDSRVRLMKVHTMYPHVPDMYTQRLVTTRMLTIEVGAAALFL